MRQWRIIGVLAAVGLVGASILGGGSAGAAGTSATLTFNAARQLVEMDIPSGGCPAGGSACTWMLYVNEPGVSGQPTVAEATGTSGTLVIPYPPDFCGVIQADALVGPGHWAYQTGTRESIQTCPGPVTAPSGGTPTPMPTPTPAGSPGTTGVEPTSSATALTAATGATTSSATPSTTKATTTKAATTLPFTGLDPGPLLMAGLAAVAIGAVLMADPRWFRRLRWITDTGAVRGLESFVAWIVGH